MTKIWDFMKSHPWAIAGGIFVVGLIFILSSRGSSSPSTAVVAQPLSDTGATTALQVATLNAQVASSQTAAQAAVGMASINAALEASKSQDSVQVANIMATADTTKYVSTLALQQSQIEANAAKDINAANISGAVQVAQIQAMSDKALSDNNLSALWLNKDAERAIYFKSADTAANIASMNTNAAVDIARISAQTTQQKQDQDFIIKNSQVFSSGQILRELSGANRLGGAQVNADGSFALATRDVGTVGWVGPGWAQPAP